MSTYSQHIHTSSSYGFLIDWRRFFVFEKKNRRFFFNFRVESGELEWWRVMDFHYMMDFVRDRF